MNRNKKLSLIAGLVCIGISAVITVMVIEFLARWNIAQVFFWIVDHPKPFALNAIMVSIVIGAMIVLTGRVIYGIAAGFIVLILFGIVNMLKLSILQSPFFAWDLFYITQMGILGASVMSQKAIFICLTLCILFAGTIIYFLIKNISLSTLRIRIFSFMITAVLLGMFCLETTNPLRFLQVENVVWDQSENYSTNGFILSFSMNISPLLFSQPEEYDRELICRLVEHNDKLEDESGFHGQPISLVFFMSESFSDLADTLCDSCDNPLENLKQITSQWPSFHIVSPTYAGNTSLVEFEVLTGLSNAFLPSGAIPFDHYLRRPTPSLAWVLQEHGYQTIAIHPFYDWFWNRNVVYPNLGFNQYLSISQFDEAANRGFYISDEALVDKIIEVIDSSEGPYFVHAVSMENHGPYVPDKYNSNEFQIAASLSDGLRFEVESYLTGLRDADRQLARLLQYLKGRKEPVICLFFGDHQPGFGMALYNEMGSMKEGIEKDYQLSVVPGLLWANRKSIIDTKDIPEQLSPVYLPAIILHQMGFPLPDYMFYLRHGLTCYPVVHHNFVIDSSGRLLRFNDRRQDPYLRGLEILNYDVLFGSRYSWKLL